MRAQRHASRLRIEPEIEFVARAGREFRIIGVRIEASPHDDETLRQLGEMRVERHGKRNIGQGPRRVNGHLVGMGMDLPNQKMRRVLGDGFGVRLALGERRSLPGTERCCRCRRLDQSGRRGQRIQELAPGTQPGHLADQRCHQARLLLRSNEGKHRAERHRHVGSTEQLQQPQSVARLVVPPGITGHDRDSENIDLRRLEQCHHRHDVGSSGAGRILIDDDHALLREGGGAGSERDENQQTDFTERAAHAARERAVHGFSKKLGPTGLCSRISSGVNPISSCGKTSHLSVSRTK